MKFDHIKVLNFNFSYLAMYFFNQGSYSFKYLYISNNY